MRAFVSLFLLTAVLCLPDGAIAQQSEAEARTQLEAVRKQIKDLQTNRKRDGAKLSKAERELKASEVAEQKARSALSKVRNELKQTEQKRDELLSEQRRQQQELEKIQSDLALQIRLAYTEGQEQRLKLILSQEDPQALGRRLVWYEYIARQRADLLAEVENQLRLLEETAKALEAETKRLVGLQAEREEALAEVQSARKERTAAVARLQQDVSTQEQRLAQLTKQAKELDSLVTQLASILPEMPSLPSGPFAQQKAKLSWPVKGKVLKSYGQQRGKGQMRWNGMLIGAPAGNNVRAFFHGRVVYADWLQGMGLLIIVEHGDGYLSLYGHNQELLHGVGSWVQPGEVIARVGDSGGQAESGVYFELRKDGKPINPRPWLKK